MRSKIGRKPAWSTPRTEIKGKRKEKKEKKKEKIAHGVFLCWMFLRL